MWRRWFGLLVLGACGGEADTGWADPPVAMIFGTDTPTVSSLEPVGDITGDGADDLVVLGYRFEGDDDDGVHLYLFDGAPGGPDDWPALSVGLAAEKGEADPVGDIDGDGQGDLALALLGSWESDVTLVLYSTAAGGLSGSLSVVFDGAQLSDARNLTREICGRADVDGDGLNDLVAVGQDILYGGEATVLVFESAQSPPALISSDGMTVPWVEAAGDLDGDGRDDVALIESYEPVMALMLGGASAEGLELLHGPDLNGYQYLTRLVSTDDLDGDGQAELAFGLRDEATEVPLYALQDGVLERVDGRPRPSQRGESFGYGIAALPLQGEPALAISDPWMDWGQGAVFLFRGAETSPSQSLAGGADAWGTGRYLENVGDLNADGAPDLAYIQDAYGYDLQWVMTVFPRP